MLSLAQTEGGETGGEPDAERRRDNKVSLSRRRLKTNLWTPPQHFSYWSGPVEMLEKKDNKKKKKKKKRREESRRC
jgi:hypothetical protein